MLIGFVVIFSLGFLVCQIIDVVRDAWHRREYRRALEVIQARNLRLFSRPMDFPFPPNRPGGFSPAPPTSLPSAPAPPPPSSPLPRGEYRVVAIPSRRGGKTEAARLEALRFPDHPIIPTRDAHFGE